MKVFDLRCAHGHVFEAWFGAEADFARQQQQGLLQCPVCGSVAIEKAPSAPHLNLGKGHAPAAPEPGKADAATEPALPQAPEDAQPVHMVRAMYERMVQQVLAHTTDVGEAFAEQARQMHAGERAEAPIRGKTSPQEAQALREEGIDVVRLAVPAASTRRLQ